MERSTFGHFAKRILLSLGLALALGSCQSYQQFQYITEEFEIPTKVFRADYTQTWQAVLAVMKTYPLEIKNQESGVIKTRWIDNTLELNFADSFGSSDSVKSARFKLIINVVKGFRANKEVAKVTVFKRQLVEHDFLQGAKVVYTDGIMEKSVLYRIERELAIDNKLKEIEDKRKEEAEAAAF
jgi:hypothetical protein